jgi:hypothetical protein
MGYHPWKVSPVAFDPVEGPVEDEEKPMSFTSIQFSGWLLRTPEQAQLYHDSGQKRAIVSMPL